jgi:hypothetical protein
MIAVDDMNENRESRKYCNNNWYTRLWFIQI